MWNRFNDDDEVILPHADQQEENWFVNEDFYYIQEQKKESYRVLYAKIQIENQPYILMVRLNIHETRKIIKSANLLQFFLFFCLMSGFVLVTRVVYKKLWKPFYLTLREIEQFNIQKNEAPQFQETSIQEFRQLNDALGKLVFNNLQAYKIQKEFTENASHEMQTPLAVFQSKLDILLQQSNLSKEQLLIIQSLYNVTSRLVRINKNLLLLAKMDNLQFPDTEALNVPVVVAGSLLFFTEQAEANAIRIETDMAPGDCIVQSNKTLLESLINNLVTNAIKHNLPEGTIHISFQNRRLVIENTVVSKELDNTALFRRFGRMSQTTKGSGLGLAIVQQICTLYQWQVEYRYDDNRHQFTIIF
ncbi:Signal-transduction histidine kinase senX3 [termite gut metagenome]|uniref:histidine kinase n=1 Tax=termite gut metagenome TaxID=433724 RepID=A0A5J4S0Z8_9ZZZZ